MQRQVESKKLRSEAKSKALFDEVFAGLDYTSGITGAIQDMLALAATTKANKREQLYNEWKAQVYDKLTDRIQDAVAARSVSEIENRLQHNYQDYLTTTNNKLAVFRDVIIEADYNPLQYQSQNVRYRTDDIRDPIERDVEKPLREAAAVRVQRSCLPLYLPFADHGTTNTGQVPTPPLCIPVAVWALAVSAMYVLCTSTKCCSAGKARISTVAASSSEDWIV